MQSRRNTVYVLIIASLFTGLFTGRALFFTLAYLFSGILLISLIWAWLAVRGIGIRRQTRSRRSQVGRTFSESFVVHNRSLIPKLWLEIRDHSDLPGHQASQVVPSLGARGRYEWHVETRCMVRGEFRLGPMTMTSGDPFGMFLLPRRINATERVIVYPASARIDQFELPMGFLSGGEAQRYLTQHITTNASSVRDYVQGDSMNRIHWKSTARRGRLIVKEFELDPLVDIWLFVDFSSRSLVEAPSVRRHGETGTIIPGTQSVPPSTEEYSVVVAASLANYFINLERALGFAAYVPHREVFHPERGNRQLTHILETLAVARSLSDRSLREMLSLETPNFTRGTTLIIVTSSLDPAWITEAQILARRGIRPMCVFVDPTSFGSPFDSDEVKGMLQLARIPSIVVQNGDDIGRVLSQRPF